MLQYIAPNQTRGGQRSTQLTWWLIFALHAISCFLQLFLPGVTIAYFMIGFPSEAYGWYLLCSYITALTAEGMIAFITQFTHNAAYAVVVAQVRCISPCTLR